MKLHMVQRLFAAAILILGANGTARAAWPPEVDAAYASRSMIGRLSATRPPCPLDINTGIHDGHTGSVPVSHAVRGFNAAAGPWPGT